MTYFNARGAQGHSIILCMVLSYSGGYDDALPRSKRIEQFKLVT